MRCLIRWAGFALLLAALTLTDARALSLDLIVTNAGDGAAGTLRAALNTIKSNPGFDRYSIGFNLAPPYRIALTGGLPGISAPVSGGVLVDGTTQPGYAGVPLVQLAAPAGVSADGCWLTGNGSEVRALRISGFTNGSGVRVEAVTNRITGCWIMSNLTGVTVADDITNTLIGGLSASNRNVISANAEDGISLGLSDQTLIQGNYIGVDPTGLADLGNGHRGIASLARGVVIGGTNAGARNVIAGNGDDGIQIQGATGIVVQGNFIGVNASGRVAVANGGCGILALAGGLTIGGGSAAARNVISGNSVDGVHLETPSGHPGSTVSGNFIGTDVTGTNAVPNGGSGIYAIGRSNMLGGASAAQGNVIAGNQAYGIWLDQRSNAYATVEHNTIGLGTNGLALSNGTPGHAGVAIQSHRNVVVFNVISGQAGTGLAIAGGDNNLVAGNLIGVDPTGALARPNGNGGVVLASDACSNQIGTVSFRNIISGNLISSEYGAMVVRGWNSVSNQIVNNFIGTDQTGRLPLGNAGDSIRVEDAADTRIEGNIVADGGIGIHILGTNVDGTVVDSNFVGVDVTGTNSLPHTGDGLWIEGGSGHRVGTGGRNILSANGGSGMTVQGPVSNLIVAGNYIGVASNGALRAGNTSAGIRIDHASGADLLFSNNVVSGNSGAGVSINAGLLTNCVLAGNIIGLSAAGNVVVSNGGVGVFLLQASNVRIGGPSVGERNVIAGNGGHGIELHQANSNGATVIAGNYLGLYASGGALPATSSQSAIRGSDTPRVQVGGPSAAWRNVIGGHVGGVVNQGGADWWIAYNYIGTDPAAALTRPNGLGVSLGGAAYSNTVENNTVSGNTLDAISLQAGPRWCTLRANRIGLGAIAPMANGGCGVRLDDASDCLVGGLDPADGNRIAYNGGSGIQVTVGALHMGQRNNLLANLIYSNNLLAIDLGGDGPTTNDGVPDADVGPNGVQNWPLVAYASAGGTNISGLFQGAPGALRLEFFALTPSLGAVLAGATNLLCPASGIAPFSFAFASNAPPGSRIVATATSGDGTSEFSWFPLALTNAVDADLDQMPDWWETLYGLNPAVSNATSHDTDADGISDVEEWIADTHPGDSNSFLHVVAFSNGPATTVFIPSSGLRRYNLEVAADPAAGSWSVALTNVVGTGALLALPDPSGYTQRVYRVGVHLP